MQCALELSLAEQHVEAADRQLLARQAVALMQNTPRPSAEDAAGKSRAMQKLKKESTKQSQDHQIPAWLLSAVALWALSEEHQTCMSGPPVTNVAAPSKY